jgi:hypothetical protein
VVLNKHAKMSAIFRFQHCSVVLSQLNVRLSSNSVGIPHSGSTRRAHWFWYQPTCQYCQWTALVPSVQT